MRIEITTEHSASNYGQPVILLDGDVVDYEIGVPAVYEAIKNLPISNLITRTLGGPPESIQSRIDATQDSLRSWISLAKRYEAQRNALELEFAAEIADGRMAESIDK